MHRRNSWTRFDFGKVNLLIGFLLLSSIGCDLIGNTDDTTNDEDPLEEEPIDEEQPSADTIVVFNTNTLKAISPYFFGQNYWSWVDQWGAQIDGTESKMAEVGLNMLRLGGISPDNNSPEPFDFQKIDEAIAYAETIGAEPILQLPLLKDFNGNEATLEFAMSIVHYVRDNNYPIRYFSIGNEPDMYVESGEKNSFSPEELSELFNPISDSIRAIDANYKVIGPDLAWKFYASNNWLSPFLENSKNHLDVVSVHRYPFHADDCTYENVLQDAHKFRQDINMIKGYFSELGMGADFPLAITETHVSYNGDPNQSWNQASPQTFFAGLWVADMIGVGMEESLWNLSFWSISEGWTLGFIDGESGEARPTFHVLNLLAQKIGNQSVKVDNPLEEFSAYATVDEQEESVILVLVNKSFEARNIAWRMPSVENVQSTDMDASSLAVLKLVQGEIIEHWEYTFEMAENQQPPKNILN